MEADWRRQALQLPSVGEISQQAVRAAYWRLLGAGGEIDKARIRQAKQQLLFELGQRVPGQRKAGAASGGEER